MGLWWLGYEVWHGEKYLSAVVDPLQDGGEVGPVFRAVLPALGHDPVAGER